MYSCLSTKKILRVSHPMVSVTAGLSIRYCQCLIVNDVVIYKSAIEVLNSSISDNVILLVVISGITGIGKY